MCTLYWIFHSHPPTRLFKLNQKKFFICSKQLVEFFLFDERVNEKLIKFLVWLNRMQLKHSGDESFFFCSLPLLLNAQEHFFRLEQDLCTIQQKGIKHETKKTKAKEQKRKKQETSTCFFVNFNQINESKVDIMCHQNSNMNT